MTKAELAAKLCTYSDEPQTEACIILKEVFGADAAEQMLCPSREYDENTLKTIIERRASHEPLGYILGYTYFCREKYFLCKDTLIPRADTELLVEYASKLLPDGGYFADLCTGSGCVAISTLKRRGDTFAFAVDISEGACSCARRNALENGVEDRLRVQCADVFALPLKAKYDAILSNPPYIPSSVIPTLSPEVAHEPKIALDGGEDGMDFYRFILANYKDNLKEGGFFALEIGYDQKELIKEAATAAGMECDVFSDYSQNPRVAIIR